jgi:hypothetical protein
VHRLGDEMVSFYLIEDGRDLLLVDAGLPRHFAQLTRLWSRSVVPYRTSTPCSSPMAM